MPGRHRLTQDYANQPEVRFLTIDGRLFSSARNQAIGSVNRALNVGDTWIEGDQ